jgi:hypothetical protein
LAGKFGAHRYFQAFSFFSFGFLLKFLFLATMVVSKKSVVPFDDQDSRRIQRKFVNFLNG